MSKGGPPIAVKNEDAAFEQDLLDNADGVIDVDNEGEDNQQIAGARHGITLPMISRRRNWRAQFASIAGPDSITMERRAGGETPSGVFRISPHNEWNRY
uniref:Uncharacterized protein n=1 Tax=Hyaloperonospora arabidopsidis (strain Emoy2) TaxID=559515 RepID=M4BS85_HYAAE